MLPVFLRVINSGMKESNESKMPESWVKAIEAVCNDLRGLDLTDRPDVINMSLAEWQGQKGKLVGSLLSRL